MSSNPGWGVPPLPADEADEAGPDPPEGGSPPGEVVPLVWDRPDEEDPPSQRPEDTYEEKRRRRAG